MMERIKERAGIIWREARDLLRAYAVALVAGLLGALASVMVMGALRFAWGAPTLPELVGQRILPLLTVDQFIKLLVTFAPHPKTTPLGLALLGQLALGVILGPIYAKIAQIPAQPLGRWPSRRAWIVAGSFVVVMEALGLILFWPILSESLVGDPVGRAHFVNGVALLLTFATFMIVMVLADHLLRLSLHADFWQRVFGGSPASIATEASSTAGMRRRELLGTAGVTILAVASAGGTINAMIAAYLKRSNLSYEGMTTPLDPRGPITPIQDFYVVSKNVLDPEVLAGQWQLEVRGLVGHERTWNYDQVRALPSETRAITLECISNGVGDRLMSTAQWTGITLSALLGLAGGAKSSGKYVKFTCSDGYTSGLPLADLLAARALLAWEMNGQALPTRHGFPLRVIVPGRYGEQSAKWLTRIEIVDQPYKGFYQSQGWSDKQLYTTSRFDAPSGIVPLAPVSVLGIAFAGIRGIQSVEVSADAGQTWNPATLTPPLSDQAWVFWQWTWTPPAKGRYTLVVRATDGTGALQVQTPQGVVPNGATGWEHIKVTVQ